ncbi:hypothetical protein M911_04250 [Ectothiorhodospira haloalkaliphila]|uniref:YchJ-like middle NTF2-like domain-containing protein n=1 Tax=Ectothiorhodospira haloalkaliphila TaxID=421628 RepID=W8KH80_9GAMM|nr:hypothetical protein M911_04250 [Ectothiorhodospira haloalkaliphila]
MRSRYTAFVEGRTDYLLDTWLPRTRPPLLDLEPNQQWLGLSIRATSAGGVGDERGEVEFVARSRINRLRVHQGLSLGPAQRPSLRDKKSRSTVSLPISRYRVSISSWVFWAALPPPLPSKIPVALSSNSRRH